MGSSIVSQLGPNKVAILEQSSNGLKIQTASLLDDLSLTEVKETPWVNGNITCICSLPPYNLSPPSLMVGTDTGNVYLLSASLPKLITRFSLPVVSVSTIQGYFVAAGGADMEVRVFQILNEQVNINESTEFSLTASLSSQAPLRSAILVEHQEEAAVWAVDTKGKVYCWVSDGKTFRMKSKFELSFTKVPIDLKLTVDEDSTTPVLLSRESSNLSLINIQNASTGEKKGTFRCADPIDNVLLTKNHLWTVKSGKVQKIPLIEQKPKVLDDEYGFASVFEEEEEPSDVEMKGNDHESEVEEKEEYLEIAKHKRKRSAISVAEEEEEQEGKDDNQTPFPNSTSWSYQDGRSVPAGDTASPAGRYLAWNTIGLITVHREPEVQKNPSNGSFRYHYDCEFHDKSTYRPVRFTDDRYFELACLGRHGAFFAGHDGNNWILYYLPFSSTRHPWTLRLGSEEIVEALAVAGDWCSFATCKKSVRFLRTVTASGIQGAIFDAGGSEVVALTGGNASQFAQFSHTSQHCLSVSLFDYQGKSLRSISQLSCPSGCRLVWAGFCCQDGFQSDMAAGIIGAMFEDLSGYGRWFAILNESTSRWQVVWEQTEGKESFWPVAFELKSVGGELVGIWTANAGPPLTPRPLPSRVPMQIPLLESTQPDSFYHVQSKILTQRLIFDVSKPDGSKQERRMQSAHEKFILELFQLCVRGDREDRAVDVLRSSLSRRTFELAVQLARHERRAGLADRIEDVGEELFGNKENNKLLEDSCIRSETQIADAPVKTNPLLLTPRSRMAATLVPTIPFPTTAMIANDGVPISESPGTILSNLTPFKEQKTEGNPPSPSSRKDAGDEGVVKTLPFNPFAAAKIEEKTNQQPTSFTLASILKHQ